MDTIKIALRSVPRLAIALAQLISTQVATFIGSMLISIGGYIPPMEDFPSRYPLPFVIFVGIAYTAGVVLTGWAAMKLGWLRIRPRLLDRLALTLLCAYIPLVAALVLYHPLQPGNPFFFVAVLTSVAGFYLPGMIELPQRT